MLCLSSLPESDFPSSGKPGTPTKKTLIQNCNGIKTYEVRFNYDTTYGGENLYYGAIDGWGIFVFVGSSPSYLIRLIRN